MVTGINDNTDVMCPWCSNDNKLSEWDKETYDACLTRESRRAFRSLKNKSAWVKNAKFFYKCPSCGQIVRGSKLKIVKTDDNYLKSLGGEDLFEVNNS